MIIPRERITEIALSTAQEVVTLHNQNHTDKFPVPDSKTTHDVVDYTQAFVVSITTYELGRDRAGNNRYVYVYIDYETDEPLPSRVDIVNHNMKFPHYFKTEYGWQLKME